MDTASSVPEQRTSSEATAGERVDEDVQRLHELGYKQKLARAWSGFTNLAISFTINLGPRRDLHDVFARVAERRSDRGVDRLACVVLVRLDGGVLDG